MKWIGQHIWDLISRFRSDVYLDNIADGTVDGNKFLGLDANNKIVKEAASTTVTDLHSAGVNGSANQILTDDGDGTITSESTLTYDGSSFDVGANDFTITSATTGKPQVEIKSTTNDNKGSILQFTSDKGDAGANDDYIGAISFVGDNSAQEQVSFGSIQSRIVVAADTDEAGRLLFRVATSDGSVSTVTTGLDLFGSALSDDVDAIIGSGTASDVTVAGNLTVTTKATIPSRVYAYPGTSDGNHTAGDIMYYDSGTATTIAGQVYYFNGSGSWTVANADAVADSTGMLAVALGTNPDVDGMLLRGFVTTNDLAGTEDHGAKIYLATTDGRITTTAPGSGNIVRVLGYNLHNTNDSVYFNPDNSWVEVS